MNTPVSFELAKLLKNKGYKDEDCQKVYCGDFDDDHPPENIEASERMVRDNQIGEFDYLAPTIAEIVMWLYEKHGVWIGCDATVNMWFYSISEPKTGKMIVLTSDSSFNSPTEAYEAAILYTLKNLI